MVPITFFKGSRQYGNHTWDLGNSCLLSIHAMDWAWAYVVHVKAFLADWFLLFIFGLLPECNAFCCGVWVTVQCKTAFTYVSVFNSLLRRVLFHTCWPAHFCLSVTIFLWWVLFLHFWCGQLDWNHMCVADRVTCCSSSFLLGIWFVYFFMDGVRWSVCW